MLAVQFLALFLSQVFRLQLQHGHVADEVLHLLQYGVYRPSAALLARSSRKCIQIGRRADVAVDGDVGTQHIDALQQPHILVFQFRVAHALLPVADHEFILGLHLPQLLRSLRIGPCGQIGLCLADSQPGISLNQSLEDAFHCNVSRSHSITFSL